MIACNVVVPQLLWSARIRRRPGALFVLAVLVNVGMWTERFMIVVASLHRDFLPSSWHDYAPTWVDLGLLAGSVSFFALLFLAFIRVVPFVPMSELKALRRELEAEAGEAPVLVSPGGGTLEPARFLGGFAPQVPTGRL
jgi:molybdopterin-containing oxidoreductase family membrane subunit